MRIQRTPRRANFTVLGNDVLRNRELSFTARGILGYLLSLPDGAEVDVRKLADKNPRIGRKGVKDAVDELIERGYYFRHTYRDDRGRVRTDTYVFDTPQAAFSPLPPTPGTGTPTPGAAGNLPSGVKDLVSKNDDKTPPTSPDPQPVTDAGQGEGDDQKMREAARILRRLAAIDTRLKLSDRHVRNLTPSVADWLDRGATIGEITDAVTQGLPAKVYSAARLIEDRLDRKRPERKRQWKQYADCAERCGRLLPAGQETGICAVCSGVELSDFARELIAGAKPEPRTGYEDFVTGEGATLLASIRARKATRTARA